MVLAGYAIEILFGVTGLTPTHRNARVLEASISWNYTTFLNLAFLALAAVLVLKFVRDGGWQMLKMMNAEPEAANQPHPDAGSHRAATDGPPGSHPT
jgi:hypothetical protein